MTTETRFHVLSTTDDKDDVEATLSVKVTDEGVVADLEIDGEVVKSWGATAQEMADDLCH